jgi:hypothetical protein
MYSPAADLDEEQDVEPHQPHRLDREEVHRQQMIRVLADELAPRSLAAAWGWLYSVAQQDFSNRDVRASMTKLQQLALDPPITPPRILARQSND